MLLNVTLEGAQFVRGVADEAFTGNPIAELLRGEISVLRSTLQRVRQGRLDAEGRTLATQHITTIGLGRGLSTPMAPRVQRRNAQVWGSGHEYVGIEDPANEAFDVRSASSVPLAPTPSGFQNAMQSRLSSVLRTASSQPSQPN